MPARRRRTAPGPQARARLLDEAARVALDSGYDDLAQARDKAAARLGIGAQDALRLVPDTRDIESIVAERQRLFEPHHAGELERLREVAREAMRFLADFKPRLAGPVLSGTAGRHSSVTLHLFADPVEAVASHLIDAGLPYQPCARRMSFGGGEREDVPGYELVVDGVPLELLVFSGRLRTRPPVDATNGRPLARASLGRLDEHFAEAP